MFKLPVWAAPRSRLTQQVGPHRRGPSVIVHVDWAQETLFRICCHWLLFLIPNIKKKKQSRFKSPWTPFLNIVWNEPQLPGWPQGWAIPSSDLQSAACPRREEGERLALGDVLDNSKTGFSLARIDSLRAGRNPVSCARWGKAHARQVRSEPPRVRLATCAQCGRAEANEMLPETGERKQSAGRERGEWCLSLFPSWNQKQAMKNQKGSSVPMGNALCTFSPSLLNMPIHSPGSRKFSPKIEAVPVGPVAGMETRGDFCSMWRNRACEQMTWSKAKDIAAPASGFTVVSLLYGVWVGQAIWLTESGPAVSALWSCTAKNIAQRLRQCLYLVFFLSFFFFNWFFPPREARMTSAKYLRQAHLIKTVFIYLLFEEEYEACLWDICVWKELSNSKALACGHWLEIAKLCFFIFHEMSNVVLLLL